MLNLLRGINRAPEDGSGGGDPGAGGGAGTGGSGDPGTGGGDAPTGSGDAGSGDGGSGDAGSGQGPGKALMGDGDQSVQVPKPEWASGMSDEKWLSIASNGYKNWDDIVDGHNAHQSKIGADKVVVPGENATAEDWKAVHTALGMPAEAKDYTIPVPDGFKPTDNDLAFQDDFRAKAHELGLNQTQVDGLANWNNGLLADGATNDAAAQSAESEATKASLRQHYGNDADAKLDAANALVANLGGDDLVAAVQKSGLSRDFSFVNAMVKLAGMAAGEGGLVGLGEGGATASLDAQIAKLTSDPGYFNDQAPNHKQLNKQVAELYKLKGESQK